MKIGYIDKIGETQPGVARPYAEIRELALAAEAEGFDSVWLWDHLLFREPNEPTSGIWESWTTLTALAEATHSIELGTLVICTQFRNPALLAKMAVTLDEISRGRFILGVGAGWHEPEFQSFGIPFDHRVSRFAEALQIIRPLLQDGRVDFAGQYYQARDCEILPRGPSPHGPPLLVAGSGPRMLGLTAEHGDLWNGGDYRHPDVFARQRADLAQACQARGRDPSAVGLTVELSAVFPDLDRPGAAPPESGQLTGSTEDIAAQLVEIERGGIAQVMIEVTPDSLTGLRRLGEAVRLYRRLAGE
jgi:alkanesulfonate monooxygenase SsuD/methylene tetrahydromethanopterin reductase-like flavin-dependent oxidoreductase (luciferase family)